MNKEYKRIFDSMLYIEYNYDLALTTKQLAGMCGLPVNRYMRLFRGFYNTSPKQYVMKCRQNHNIMI